MRVCCKVLLVAALWCVPSLAFAQASLTGVVRDASGAVLPGVTVEASSPALIEKVRVVVTDDAGRYRIENLRPGTYAVAFTLPGFSVVRREGIELAGTFVATVNADLRVGGLEETITVTAETPLIDVQSASRQAVINQEMVDLLPTGRNRVNVTDLLPGVQAGGAGDVGGTGDIALGAATTSQGSAARDTRLEIGGLSLTIVGGANQFSHGNMTATQETTVDTSGISAEIATGGVRINTIPKEGGNRFSGTMFATYTNESMQGDNFNDALRASLGQENSLKRFWDINPGLGGPLLQDKLWFYASYKNLRSESYAAGVFENRNANNPNVWTWDPDRSTRPFNQFSTWDATARLTWQATDKFKFGLMNQEVNYCACSDDLKPDQAPEATPIRRAPSVRHTILDWTAPFSNRLLFDGGVLMLKQMVQRDPQPQFVGAASEMISVTDQALGLTYRAIDQSGGNPVIRQTWWKNWQARASLSYITGTHALKFGTSFSRLNEQSILGNVRPGAPMVAYRFNNGVPNRITVFGYPSREHFIGNEMGLFVQDRWTVDRLTLSGGMRYDFHEDVLPAITLEPSPMLPHRNLSFPENTPVSWHDITWRSGAAYDLFGTGRTAVRATLNKYLADFGRLGRRLSPTTLLGNSTTRAWRDANGDFVPQCDLIAPDANGECGPLANRNFGGARVSDTYDPDLLFGWGKRSYNWEFSTGIQHEIVSRVSMDVAYFRRSYGNLWTTDNRAVTPADFTEFSVPVPGGISRLPTSGQELGGYLNLNNDKVGRVDRFITLASNYGDQTERWDGFVFNLNARLQNGLFFQGGASTGRVTRDTCEIRAALPETAPTNPFCDTADPWAADQKLMVGYTVPKIDVQVSSVFKRVPGPLASARFVAANELVQGSLGRPLSGRARNVTVDVAPRGSILANHITTLDLRLGKILRNWAGPLRATINLDVFNLLNSVDALQVNQVVGIRIPYLDPRCTSTRNACETVLKPRMFKISTQIDF